MRRVGQTPLILLANPNVPAADLKEFLALAKRDPKRFMFANSAAGSAGHLTTIEFNRLSGLRLDIVTYRGSALALTDLIGGHVHLMVDPLGVALPHVKAGKLKALAITSRERNAAAPDIPTVAESGMPELVFSSWYGVWGPRSLPAEAIAGFQPE